MHRCLSHRFLTFCSVWGDGTFAIKDELSAIGGKWNPHIKKWIFSPSRKKPILELVRSKGGKSSLPPALDFGEDKEVKPYILQPTQEQLDCFSFAQKDAGHGVIEAVAGSGKTTLILETARRIHIEAVKDKKVII
jgi:hypothetical protein